MALTNPSKHFDSTKVKFSQLELNEFVDDSFERKLAYFGIFFAALAFLLTYISDIGALVLLITGQNLKDFRAEVSAIANVNWSMQIDFIYLVLILSCSLFASITLLLRDWNNTIKIVRSDDVSLAFASLQANRYYSLKAYAYYCLFCTIEDNQHPIDKAAFFSYFSFQGWIRLIFVVTPRALINLWYVHDITIAIWETMGDNASIITLFPTLYRLDRMAFYTYLSLFSSVLFWALGILRLFIAVVVYIPLIIEIKGNLKEFCVTKVDKRLASILSGNAKRRRQNAKNLELNRVENGEIDPNQPTLPGIDVDLNSIYDESKSYTSSIIASYALQPPIEPQFQLKRPYSSRL